MCVYVCVGVRVFMRASWDLMNLNQPRWGWGGGGVGWRFDHRAPAQVCVCVQLCEWWREGWVTDPAPYDPLPGIWQGLQMIKKLPAITRMCARPHTHTHAHKAAVVPFLQPPPPPLHCQSPNKHSTSSNKRWSMGCKHTGYVTANE